MRGAQVGASKEMVAAALGPGGERVCAEMVRALASGDKVAAERAARGLKKVSEARADAGLAALWGLRKQLLREAERAADVRVQWNLTIAIGRLPLKGRDKALAVELMFERLRDRSGLNRTFALQALWDLSEEDAGLRRRVMPVLSEFLESGTAAMKARARRLVGRAGKSG